MARTIAEINADNERFLSAIINEQTADAKDIFNVDETVTEETQGTEIPDGDPTDPTAIELVVQLCNGEEAAMAFTVSVFNEMMEQLPSFDKMISILQQDIVTVYSKGYSKELEERTVNDLSEMGINVEYNTNNDALRLVLLITDLKNIYTVIAHALHEKQLTEGIFGMLLTQQRNFNMEENKNENN